MQTYMLPSRFNFGTNEWIDTSFVNYATDSYDGHQRVRAILRDNTVDEAVMHRCANEVYNSPFHKHVARATYGLSAGEAGVLACELRQERTRTVLPADADRLWQLVLGARRDIAHAQRKLDEAMQQHNKAVMAWSDALRRENPHHG